MKLDLVTVVLGLAVLGGCSSSSAGALSEEVPDGSPPLGPGCLGTPDESCAPYPAGTQCPGGPQVCAPCGPGLYTPSSSLCVCTSGNWACAPPKAGEITCSSPIGNYTDPSCSVPYAADAGVDGSRDSGEKG